MNMLDIDDYTQGLKWFEVIHTWIFSIFTWKQNIPPTRQAHLMFPCQLTVEAWDRLRLNEVGRDVGKGSTRRRPRLWSNCGGGCRGSGRKCTTGLKERGAAKKQKWDMDKRRYTLDFLQLWCYTHMRTETRFLIVHPFRGTLCHLRTFNQLNLSSLEIKIW